MDDLTTIATKFIQDVDSDIALAQTKWNDAQTAKAALQTTVDSLTAGKAVDAATIADMQARLDALDAAHLALGSALSSADQRAMDAGSGMNPPVPLPPVVPAPTA